ncbi:RNA-binding motif protein, X-linked 2 [Nymphon striatum]|nr:RNA-binding motif protein, X-linked 2 [Nymphon striatum]
MGTTQIRNVRNIQKLNERELNWGISGSASWHHEYRDSAWIFIGGMPYELSEGDIITVFSQYGEIVNINLVRDKKTGKSKGYAFLCYEDQRSTILAVDNLNSTQILKRTIRVDHVMNYKMPKEHEDDDEITTKLKNEGCAPKIIHEEKQEEVAEVPKKLKVKKAKKKKSKGKKSKKRHHSSSSSSSSSDADTKVKVKIEKIDPAYGDYDNGNQSQDRQKKNYDKSTISKKFNEPLNEKNKSRNENSKSMNHSSNLNRRRNASDERLSPEFKNDDHFRNSSRHSNLSESYHREVKREKIYDSEVNNSKSNRHLHDHSDHRIEKSLTLNRHEKEKDKHFSNSKDYSDNRESRYENPNERKRQNYKNDRDDFREGHRRKRTHSSDTSESEFNVSKMKSRRRSRSKESSPTLSNKNKYHHQRKVSCDIRYKKSRSRSQERYHKNNSRSRDRNFR